MRLTSRSVVLTILAAVVTGAAVRTARPQAPVAQPNMVDETAVTTLVVRRTTVLTPRLVRLAASKAHDYWGGTRCRSIRFVFRPLPGSLLAQAYWEAFPGSTRYLNCRVTFDANRTKVKTTFLSFCGAVVHEYGHLSGHGHVADPRKIMNPVLSKKNMPATCKTVS